MNDSEATSELARLDAEHPTLMELLRRTPTPPEVDTGKASGEEVLMARALTILGSATARSSGEQADTVILSGRELQILLGIGAHRDSYSRAEIERLRGEVDQIRKSQMTADGVRVLVAKMVAATLVAAAAIAAIVGAIVAIA
ncbi:MAG TPA: hypothetical protein VIT89_06065 [Solirubrobacterales bacterium]